MTRKFKLLILSLLGFSAACSGVKNSAKSQPEEEADSMSTVVRPDIRLMYGVRRPVPVGKVDSLGIDTLKTVADEERQQAPEVKEAQPARNPHIVAMYGVRVPMENIDLDSLKRAQQELRQPEQPQNDDNQ